MVNNLFWHFRLLLMLSFVILTTEANLFDNYYNNAKINCFIRHLKGERILDEKFEEFPSQTNFSIADCKEFITDVQSFYYNRVRNGTTFDFETPEIQDHLGEQGECIEMELRKDKYGDYILKALIYDALKPLSNDLAKDRNSTLIKLRETLSSAISSCTFSTLYDAYIQIRRHNYCARKYVVDNDIMGLKSFNLTLNPYHIDVSQINCKEIIQSMVDELSNNEDDTTIGDVDAIQLLSHEWAVIFLTEINVSNKEREIERKKYEQDTKKIYQKH